MRICVLNDNFPTKLGGGHVTATYPMVFNYQKKEIWC